MSATNQAGAGDVAAFQAGTTGDPFPSWREDASQQAVLDLVQRVTADGDEAMPAEERVALFDYDGTGAGRRGDNRKAGSGRWVKREVLRLAVATLLIRIRRDQHERPVMRSMP
jgi:hypothetical protein